jgi:hypothetical protein
MECERCRAFIGPEEDRVMFTVQAYTDDIIFISKTAEDIGKMLRILERFVNWSKMEVNVKKCATISYLCDGNRRQSSLTYNFTFKDQEILNLTLAQSLKYLGTSVMARRTVKLETIKAKLIEIKIRFQKIIESPLLIVQKIDTMKTFVLPTLDFMMLNGDVGKKQLIRMDKYIRRKVDKTLKMRDLPIECHHTSWRDGRLSYSCLVY